MVTTSTFVRAPLPLLSRAAAGERRDVALRAKGAGTSQA